MQPNTKLPSCTHKEHALVLLFCFALQLPNLLLFHVGSLPETERREWPSKHCMASAAGGSSLKLTRAHVLPGNTLTASRGPNLPNTVSIALSFGRVAMLPSRRCLLGWDAAAKHMRWRILQSMVTTMDEYTYHGSATLIVVCRIGW